MAKDPNSTKPDSCSLDKADWVSATEVGEHIAQINHGAWMLAPGDIRDAILGGCGAVLELEQNGQKSYCIPPPRFWFPPDRLRWVNELNPSMRREEYHDRRWPWELRAYLPPNDPWEFRRRRIRARSARKPSAQFPLAREQASTLRVFLRRAEAVQWGLLPALESPQAVASEELTSPPQPGEPTVGSAGGEAASAPAPAADILEQNTETTSSASAASPTAPQTNPAPSSAPKKRSRRKTVYRSAQRKRAGAVLKRIFKEGNYPAETEVEWVDLWHQFGEEYERYVKDNPSPSKLPMPSERTVRRQLGWE